MVANKLDIGHNGISLLLSNHSSKYKRETTQMHICILYVFVKYISVFMTIVFYRNSFSFDDQFILLAFK